MQNIIDKICPQSDKSIFTKRRRVYYDMIKSIYVYNKYLKEREWIWGIDPSYRGTGIAMINLRTNDIILDKIVTNEKSSLIKRTDDVINKFKTRYKQFTPAIIIMESTFFDKTKPISLVLSKLNHALEMGIYYIMKEYGGALYKGVAPPSIKKFIIGGSNKKRDKKFSSKDFVRDGINKIYKHNIEDNDMADALAMALLGQKILELLIGFNLSKFDFNEENDMLRMYKGMVNFVDKKNKHRGESIFSVLANVNNGMASLTDMMPELDVLTIKRVKSRAIMIHTSCSNISDSLDKRKYFDDVKHTNKNVLVTL